ncbi:MAG TPA: hypothetical protein VM101_03160 [Flavitalea sp.]|nr:hypothetical protein [Flavitalea sp.]
MNAYKLKYLSVNLFRFISVAAVISHFLPLVILLLKKAWHDRFFLLFAMYWCLSGVVNLADVVPGESKNSIQNISIFYNMLNIPFILGILYYTTAYNFIRKTASAAIVLVLVLQVISIFKSGIGYDSLKYPLGTGVLTVICIVAMEIIRYMQKIDHSTRENAKMFVYAAILFENATFIIIYIHDYFLISEDYQDRYFIYYISTLVAIMIASCGFLIYKKYSSIASYLKS